MPVLDDFFAFFNFFRRFFSQGIYFFKKACYTIAMKGGIFKRLYTRIRCSLFGLSFPVEDELFDAFHADEQGALAQSREGDKLQIVHVELPQKSNDAENAQGASASDPRESKRKNGEKSVRKAQKHGRKKGRSDRRFAAFVYNIPLNRVIGKVGPQLTQDLLRVFKKGFCLDGEIVSIVETEKGMRKCYFRALTTCSFMSPYLGDLAYLSASHNE